VFSCNDLMCTPKLCIYTDVQRVHGSCLKSDDCCLLLGEFYAGTVTGLSCE